MRKPAVISASELQKWDAHHGTDLGWVPARPIGHPGQRFPRLVTAWRVLIGRYDAIDWFPSN